MNFYWAVVWLKEPWPNRNVWWRCWCWWRMLKSSMCWLHTLKGNWAGNMGFTFYQCWRRYVNELASHCKPKLLFEVIMVHACYLISRLLDLKNIPCEWNWAAWRKVDLGPFWNQVKRNACWIGRYRTPNWRCCWRYWQQRGGVKEKFGRRPNNH